MRSRKGLSTVVGMVFALIALATSVGYITYSMSTLDQYDKTVIAKNQQTIDNVKENFQIYSATITNNKFNIAITNTGNLPINITRVWIQNTTNPAVDWVNYYPINKLVSPGANLINIGQASPVYANPAYAYNVKLITSRGNSLQFNMGSPGTKPLYMQLIITPQMAIGNPPRNVTILYQVTNNLTSNNLLTNLQANVTCSTGDSGRTIPTFALIAPYSFLSSQTYQTYPTLPSGSTATFKWIYQMSGTLVTGQNRYCVAKLLNGLSTNTASEYVFWQQP